MAPIRNEGSTTNWNDVVAKCFDQMIDLTVKETCLSTEVTPCTVLGVCCAEVEVDILSGTFLVKRVDILEDIGESVNPGIDIVQVTIPALLLTKQTKAIANSSLKSISID